MISLRYSRLYKSIAGESKSVTGEVAAPLTEITLPTILSRCSLENIFNASVESAAKFVLSDWLLGMLMMRGFPCLLKRSEKTQKVSKALKVCHVDTVLKAKVECLQNVLKNGYWSSIESLVQLKGRLS